MPAYCLFCMTQYCDSIAARLSENKRIKALSPRILQRKWVRGHVTEEAHPYLPGYIFVYSEEDIVDRLYAEGVIRVLGNAPLRGPDLEFARMIESREGIIGSVKVYRTGDRLSLLKGPMNGLEGEILKVDKNRARLLMKFDFDRTEWKVWVGYDVVEQD